MAKKQIPRPRRHLRAVPQTKPPAPPTFAALVDQVQVACRAHAWQDLETLFERLQAFPEAQQVQTADPQKLYFAYAAWYWQLQAEEYQAALTDAEHKAEDAFDDAVTASRKALAQLIQSQVDRLGAPGAADPSLQEVLAGLLTQMEEAMREALRDAMWEREAREARDEQQA